MKKLRTRFERFRSARCRIQVLSDLHLELSASGDYSAFQVPVKAPVLLLAGDVGQIAQTDAYARFLLKQSERFEMIPLVLGNLEFYGCSRP